MSSAVKMSSASKGHRLEWIDIAKGVGIISVVYGHAMGPELKYVYLFHLPLFMILSGYLYNEKDSFFLYVWKKFKGIYIPFAGWNMIIMLLRMLYAKQNGFWEQVAPARIEAMWQTLLCVNKDASYFGGTWYLGALFLISIVYKLIDIILPKTRNRQYIILILFAGVAVFGFLNNLPLLQSRTLILSFFFAFGRFLKARIPEVVETQQLMLAILLWSLFWTTGHFTNAAMASNEYENPLLFIACAFMGSFGTIYFSRWLDNRRFPVFLPFQKVLSLLGRYSMDILIWHFVAFRLVVLYQLWQEGEPLISVVDIGSRYHTDGMWWIAYLLVGLIVSLIWSAFLRIGPWGWLLKKLCLVRS